MPEPKPCDYCGRVGTHTTVLRIIGGAKFEEWCPLKPLTETRSTK